MSKETMRIINIFKYAASNPKLKVEHQACGLSFSELIEGLNK